MQNQVILVELWIWLACNWEKCNILTKLRDQVNSFFIIIGNSTLFLTIINLDPLSRRVEVDY